MISSNLIAFLVIQGALPPRGWGWVEWVYGGLGMMWGPSRECGNDGNDVGMVGTTWGPRGQQGHGVETTETTAMVTSWGPSGGYGDDMGTRGMMWGQCGDDMGMMGTMWG